METMYLADFDATPCRENGKTVGIAPCDAYYKTIVEYAKVEDRWDRFSRFKRDALIDRMAFILGANHAERVLHGIDPDIDCDVLYSKSGIQNALLLKKVAEFGATQNASERQKMAMDIALELAAFVLENFSKQSQNVLEDDYELANAKQYLEEDCYDKYTAY